MLIEENAGLSEFFILLSRPSRQSLVTKSSNPPLAQEGGLLETVPEGLVLCIFTWQIPGQWDT